MYTSRLIALSLILIVCCVLFMVIGARGDWSFVLGFRGKKLLALILVSAAVSISTLLLQTISGNRILAPGIIGFDALYLLILTSIIFLFGGMAYSAMSKLGLYFINLGLLIITSFALYGTLLNTRSNDLTRMILTGIVIAVFFRSLTEFMKRMIDPNDFALVQGASFASFNKPETERLAVSTVILVLTLFATWRMRNRLNLLAEGYVFTTNLGENFRREQLKVLTVISVLVAVSTSLVGPIVFFGLLVTSITYRVMPTYRHDILLAACTLLGAITLVGGQLVLERIMNLSTPLSVVVEFLGGIIFLFLLLRGSRT